VITLDTKVGALLEAHPELVEVLASYHPHFKRLRNRLLRRVVAPRVSLGDAARMAGVAPDDLLAAVARAIGEEVRPTAPKTRAESCAAPRPGALDRFDEAHRAVVDVRANIARGEEPFARIMAAVKSLPPDHALVVRTPFEPIPLYDVLGRRGLAHWSEQRDTRDWTAWFWRDATPMPTAPAPATPGATVRATLDVRGLEPPQPMVLVLERLTTLAPGETLEVLHDRRPLFLYPQLDDRGFVHETEVLAPGLVRIRICRPADAA
jgi:uncharacterized protein (DUF2249 family)